MLRFRALTLQKIRNFFIGRDYLETDTPALSPALIPETCLEVFKTAYIEPWTAKKRDLFLVPSPEIYMKKIIAQHGVSVFQLSKCYRNVESCGNIHSPEFTMLEYYTMAAGYRESMMITEDLLRFLSPRFEQPFAVISVNDAFKKLAGFYLFDCDENDLRARARELNLETAGCVSWADLYQLIFVHAVESRLACLAAAGQPLFLTDYPARVSCLAKDGGEHAKERWELYIDGIELANCYSEEINPQKVRRYFTEEGRLKKGARVRHKTDKNYWRIFRNFPDCSGVALGVDRLLMILAEKKSIDSVLPFPLTP